LNSESVVKAQLQWQQNASGRVMVIKE